MGWNVEGRKIRCLNGSCSMDSQVTKDDSKFVEFLSIHILLTPVWLVFMLQYFSSPVFMTVSILVIKLDNCFVADKCYNCNKKYSAKDIRVRDHCHITGKCRGSAHQDSNINYRLTDKLLFNFPQFERI